MQGTLSVVLCLLALLLITAAEIDSRKERRRRLRLKEGRSNTGKCKYFRKGMISDCDLVTKTRSVTFELKKGANCPQTQVYTQPCSEKDNGNESSSDIGCKYLRKSQWSECGPGVLTKTKVMQLKHGQPSSCSPTRTKTKPCKDRKRNKIDKNRPKKKVCKYFKGAWSECNSATKTRTRELTLKKGDQSTCLPKKMVIKKCKKPCKYMKGPWTACNDTTNLKERLLTLKKGDPNICNATVTLSKLCRHHGAFTASKTSKCRYKLSAWGVCDAHLNTMTRTLTLKSGDPDLCPRTKQLTRKCRKPCKYYRGEWSECNNATKMRTRSDRLVKGDPSLCTAPRILSKKCDRDSECHYKIGNWGECDPVSKMRSRVKTLQSGDPTKCKAQAEVRRPCFRPNGEESCFLGPWGDFGPCMNGVMMKHRPVIAGGVQCERKAVKAKPCS